MGFGTRRPLASSLLFFLFSVKGQQEETFSPNQIRFRLWKRQCLGRCMIDTSTSDASCQVNSRNDSMHATQPFAYVDLTCVLDWTATKGREGFDLGSRPPPLSSGTPARYDWVLQGGNNTPSSHHVQIDPPHPVGDATPFGLAS